MRVLHVAASLAIEWGGPPQAITHLASALAKRHVSSTIYASAIPRNGHLIETPCEAATFPVGFGASVWRGRSPELSRALRNAMDQHDLVHIYELWHHPHYAAVRAAQQTGTPYVISPLGALEDAAMSRKGFRKRAYTVLFQRRALRQASAVHVMTESERTGVLQLAPGAKVALLPLGVDVGAFTNLPPRETLNERFPELSGKRVLLFLGRIHPIKGLPLAVEALARLSSDTKFDDVVLLIAGPDEGGYQTEVEAHAKGLGVRARVIFTGLVAAEDKQAVLARADAFVLPSLSEGFSVALLEALASGLPAVITAGCNFPELAAADAGRIVPRDPQAMELAFADVLGEGRMRMAANARGLVAREYGWDRIAEGMHAIYDEGLEGTVRS
jgi:glycosyltransferase involved in cell wall biosynthesis